MPESDPGRSARSWYLRNASILSLLLPFFAGLGAANVDAADTAPGRLTPLRVQHYQGLLINQSTYVALYSGTFKKHGLDVTLIAIPSGPAVEAAVHAKSLDVGTQDVDQMMINTHLQNLNFTTICGAEGSYYQVVANKEFKFMGPTTYPEVMKEFVGKRLGVTALGADTYYYWQALFQAAGLSPDSGKYVGTGVGQQSLSAMEHNLVDATMGFEPLTSIEVQNGARIVLNLSKGEGPPETRNTSPQLVYFVDKSFLAEHPDTVKAFNEAILEAVKFQQDPKNFGAVLGYMKQALGPLGDSKGFDQMVRDNIAPSSITGVTMGTIKAWLSFSQSFLKFPKDVTPEAIYKEIVWEDACK